MSPRCSTLTRRLRKLSPSRFTSPASGVRIRASTSLMKRPPRLTWLSTVGDRGRLAVRGLDRALAAPGRGEPEPGGGRSGDEDVACAGVDEHVDRQPVHQHAGRILAASVSLEKRFPVAGGLALGLGRWRVGRHRGRSGRERGRRTRGQPLQQRKRAKHRRRDAHDHDQDHAPEHAASARSHAAAAPAPEASPRDAKIR